MLCADGNGQRETRGISTVSGGDDDDDGDVDGSWLLLVAAHTSI